MKTISTVPRDLSALMPTSAEAPPPALTRPAYPWKTRLVLPAGILIALLAILAYATRQALWPATDVHVVPVVLKAGTETPKVGAVVQAAGWIEPDPYAIAVTALADGVVKDVLVLEGQSVEAGQVVARLVDADARLALARAEAELDARRAELAAAQQQWDHPVERARAVATAGASVAESKAELLQLTSDTAAEEARVVELSEQFELTKKNYQSQAASEIEYLTLRRKLEAQRATLEATKARGPVLQAQLEQREAELVAARKNQELRIEETQALSSARADLAQATAMRDEARLRLERMEIVAPASGVVLNRHVAPGSKLMLAMDSELSSAVCHLYDPRKLQIRVDVPLADAARVGVGMEAQIVVGVLPDHTFTGAVTRIVQEADVSKNTLQVKVAINDPSPALKPEMLARVRFIAPQSATAPASAAPRHLVFAPESLIASDGGNASAWVVDRANGVAQRRNLVLGNLRQDGWVSVRSGLSAGDRLIAETRGLSEGARVSVVGETDLTTEGGHGVH